MQCNMQVSRLASCACCGDLAKGTLPVMLFCALFGLEPTFWLSFAVAAPVLGHTCSPWGGGKGIAVSFGVMLGLLPGSMGLLFLIGSYLLFSIIIRIKPHGIRSIVSFAVFFVAMLIWERHTFLVYGALLMCAAVIIRHLPSARREYEARHPRFLLQKIRWLIHKIIKWDFMNKNTCLCPYSPQENERRRCCGLRKSRNLRNQYCKAYDAEGKRKNGAFKTDESR